MAVLLRQPQRVHGVVEFDGKSQGGCLEDPRWGIKGQRKRGVVGTGAMSDPYNPLEKECINERGSGTYLITSSHRHCHKSDLVTRDTTADFHPGHSPVLVR